MRKPGVVLKRFLLIFLVPALSVVYFITIIGITVCRCCGGTIGKEEAACNHHVCKSCEAFIDETLPEREPQVSAKVPSEPVSISSDFAHHVGE